MKKIILAALLMTTAVTASAAGLYYKLPSDAKAGYFAVYDKDGKLCDVRAADISGDSIPAPDFGGEDVQNVKLYLDTGAVVTAQSGQDAPAVSPSPAPDEDNFPERPAAYQNDAQSFTATALVKSVKTAYEDNETVYKVTLLWWGNEYELTLDSSITILGASDAYSDLEGMDASALKAGDVIIPAYIFKTAPKGIFLVYRPSKGEPVFDETLGYLPLYTADGYTGCGWRLGSDEIDYHFGIVTKSNSRYIELMEPNGLASRAKEISIDKNTMIYSYDTSYTNSAQLSGAVSSTPVSKSNIDADGNVKFDSSDDFVYALVREIDGVAVEVITYEN